MTPLPPPRPDRSTLPEERFPEASFEALVENLAELASLRTLPPRERAYQYRLQATLYTRMYLLFTRLMSDGDEAVLRDVLLALGQRDGTFHFAALLRWDRFMTLVRTGEQARQSTFAGQGVGECRTDPPNPVDDHRARLAGCYSPDEVAVVLDEIQRDCRLSADEQCDLAMEAVGYQMMAIAAAPRRHFLLTMADVFERGDGSVTLERDLLASLGPLSAVTAAMLEESAHGARADTPTLDEWQQRVALEELLGPTVDRGE